MPAVSIITATWNRSNVLRLAIESVLASTFADWELIVVGDACTDDTGGVVRSFGDPRIAFVNLLTNSGEQATPNNEGIRLARGEHVAFLNHDDLWTRDHLATCVEGIRGADMVWTTTLSVDHLDRVRLAGACPRGEYDPRVFVPASSWLVRRSLVDRVGPWRPARSLFLVPSQDWIFRAWKSGARLVPIGKADVIAVASGVRARSYADRHVDDVARYAAMLRDDADFGRLLDRVEPAPRAGFLRDAFASIVVAAGFHPLSFSIWRHYRRRGGLLDSLRGTRGLPPLPRPEESS